MTEEAMRKEDQEWFDETKRKLGREKFGELAALVWESKVAGTSPTKVKEKVKARFGLDIPPKMVFIKH